MNDAVARSLAPEAPVIPRANLDWPLMRNHPDLEPEKITELCTLLNGL